MKSTTLTRGKAKVVTASVTACAVGAFALPAATASPTQSTAVGERTYSAGALEPAARAPGTILSR